MKKILLFAATAALFAACTSDEATVPEVAQEAPQAVAFDTYTATASRAGKERVMTTTELMKASGEGGGFGVFAQYSDNTTYAPATGSNFMWNQGVFYNNTAMGWEYAPLKYWPNETVYDSQTVDGGHAESTDFDRLSFFAYAPYVANVAGTYDGTLEDVEYTGTDPNAPKANQTGIVMVTANDATSDPKVMYKVTTDPSKTVDLLWGVAPAGGLSYETVKNKENWVVNEGMPLLNLIKPNKDQKMKFLFQHALSRIGITVVGAFDQIAAGGKKDSETKVLVEEVNIYEAVANSIKTQGWLNLNNGTANVANWETFGSTDYTNSPIFTISGTQIHPDLLDKGDEAFATQPVGVTAAPHNIFADANDFFAVIPSGNTKLNVKITYYVQTKDASLNKVGSVDGSRVKNVIKKSVTVDFQNGKSYNLKLILGLTSVKLDAEVADWQLAGDSEVNLPRNNE
jgi:hypothetical protein